MSADPVLDALSKVGDAVDESNLGGTGKIRLLKLLLDVKDAILDEVVIELRSKIEYRIDATTTLSIEFTHLAAAEDDISQMGQEDARAVTAYVTGYASGAE